MGRRPKGTVGELRSETKALKATKEAKAAKETTEEPARAPVVVPTPVVTCESCVYFSKPYCTKNPPAIWTLREPVDFNRPPLYKDRMVSAYPTCIVELPCGEYKKK